MMKIASAFLVFSLIAPTQANAQDPFSGRVLAPHFYHRLSKCETGQKWTDAGTRKNYTSGFGIARGVWQRYSNSSGADRYTPTQQSVIVDRIAFLGFTKSDGTFIPPVGPWGWAVVRSNCMNLQKFICKSRRAEVARWKRHCK